MGIEWETANDAFQANKIAVDRLCDMQNIFAKTLCLAYRMTSDALLRQKIESVTKSLHDEYAVWHAEWKKHPSFETLIPRLNHHIDVYENLTNEILKDEKTNRDGKDLYALISEMNGKLDVIGGLASQTVENTTPKEEDKPRKNYPVSQPLAAEILTRMGAPTTARTIQNWESGKGTPKDYSAEKCRISIQAFQAWADGHVSTKRFTHLAREETRARIAKKATLSSGEESKQEAPPNTK